MNSKCLRNNSTKVHWLNEKNAFVKTAIISDINTSSSTVGTSCINPSTTACSFPKVCMELLVCKSAGWKTYFFLHNLSAVGVISASGKYDVLTVITGSSAWV